MERNISKLFVIRAKYFYLAAITALIMDKKDIDEYNELEFYLWCKCEMRMCNFEVYRKEGYYWYRAKPLKGEPIIIKTWHDLAQLKPINGIYIHVDFDYYNGEIHYKGTAYKSSKYLSYLSTHSLYEEMAARTENILKCYGFNVKVIGDQED